MVTKEQFKSYVFHRTNEIKKEPQDILGISTDPYSIIYMIREELNDDALILEYLETKEAELKAKKILDLQAELDSLINQA